jgi:type 1 glutamine amidotransferase
MLIGEDEYQTEQTLPKFALKYLGQDFRSHFVFASDADHNDFPGIAAIDDADALLVSVRRRLLPTDQLAHVRSFVASGKPVLGIRTASHAFSPREGAPPAGHDSWPEFDAQVLGGHYAGHHGNHPPDAPRTLVQVVAEKKLHPILQGLKPTPQVVPSWLYKTSPLATGAEVLVTGLVEGREPSEPVAWTYVPATGNRVFYTSLGHPEEFDSPEFRRLLVNGIYWATGTSGAENVFVRSRAAGKR